MFNERNNYLQYALECVKQCDIIISKMEAQGKDMYKSKRLVSELEQELKELQGMRRSRYTLETYMDVAEIAEFYLGSLRKGGRIL